MITLTPTYLGSQQREFTVLHNKKLLASSKEICLGLMAN